jgi:dTDP-glucose 4,6-dehydratase
MKILLTGAAGMVGSNILSHLLKNTNHEIVCLCSWRHRGEPRRILEEANYQANKHRVKVVTHDLVSPLTEDVKKELGSPDIILNIASESHVDRSITDPVEFTQNNVNLALHMLEYAREAKPKLFLQFSTDEVYGQAPIGVNHAEWSPIIPSNPYSASKAAQEAIAISYWRTYGVPVILTNTMNVFAQNQDFEKFIPLCVKKILKGEVLSIHSYPDKKTAGSRFYIHARNVADAVLHIMDNIEPKLFPEVDRPERFNIVGEKEVDNLTLAQLIASFLGKELKYELVDFHSARPGHDCRYALDGQRLAQAGWQPNVSFEESLKSTVLALAKEV